MLIHRVYERSWILALGAVIAGCYARDTEGLECAYDSDCLGLRCIGRLCSATEEKTGAVSVAVGSEQACAVLGDGTARCWGADTWGQLGYPDPVSKVCGTTPKRLGPINLGAGADGVNVLQIATGGGIFDEGDRYRAHTCALLEGGRLKCWGMGSDETGSGWLGYENIDNVLDPAVAPLVPLTRTVRRIAVGDRYTCAIFDDGRLGCWGMGARPRGSQGTDSVGGMQGDIENLIPVSFGTDVAVRAVSAGYAHACAVLENNTAWCWGEPSKNGRLGIGADGAAGTSVPLRVTFDHVGMGAPLDVRTGLYHSCALLANDAIACWGCNVAGALGLRGDDPSLKPVLDACQVGAADRPVLATEVQAALAGAHIVQLVSGGNHNCVLLADRSVRCWGENQVGQLGVPFDGDAHPAPIVVKMNGDVLRAVEIASAASQVCAVTDTGAVVCWGDNTFGQAGFGACVPTETLPRPVDLL